MDGQSRHAWVAQTGIALVILAVTLALVTPAIRQSLMELLRALRGGAEAPLTRPAQATDLAAFRDRFAHPRSSSNNHSSEHADESHRTGTAGAEGTAENQRRGAPASVGTANDAWAAASSLSDAPGDQSGTATAVPNEARGDAFPRVTLQAPPSTPAPATSESSAAQAVEARRSAFKVMGSDAKAMIVAFDGSPSDVSTISTRALHIAQLAVMIPDLFAIDTHKFATSTRALPKIWTEESMFDAKANELAAGMNEIVRLAQTSPNSFALRVAGARALATCGVCHRAYVQVGAVTAGVN
jgi:cytochrome c556